MELTNIEVFGLVIEIIIFLILVGIGMLIYKKIRDPRTRLLKVEEYFPEDEIHSLKQVSYLIMMGLFFINILYSLTFTTSDVIYLVIFDIALSLYVAVVLDKSTLKNKILLLLLVPYGSLTYLLFGNSLIGLVDLIHIPVFLYFIKVYYDKFRSYTESNSLGITVILLFTIVFMSFLVTQVVENVNALDALVMVSNAFTSNGYAILGHSIPGKLNSILLVWGGYILSGVGTSTLTAAILIKHFNGRLDEFKDDMEEMKELIKENKKD